MTKSSGSWQSWGFMQLNPARGRKLHTACLRYDAQYLVVYAAQPREGTETRISPLHNPPNRWVVYAAQPREGTETRISPLHNPPNRWVVYAAQPREGTETRSPLRNHLQSIGYGLCSSTPRGDGNSAHEESQLKHSALRFMQLNPARGRKLSSRGITIETFCASVYAAQPREGTETQSISSHHTLIVMGLCSSTPRGDGNILHLLALSDQTSLVYAAQPREGTETNNPINNRSNVFRFQVYAAQPREGTETRVDLG